MSLQAIVLAGGLGTRLRPAVKDLPKAMAPVAGRPFLEHLFDNLATHGFERIILATGYRADAIRTHFGEHFGPLSIAYSEEETPLGTGGATWKALALAKPGPCFILNGDTWIDVDYAGMMANHLKLKSRVTIAVREVPEVARFGAVEVVDCHITRFHEKGPSGPGLINAGVYLLGPEIVSAYPMPPAFSLERDFFQGRLEALEPSAWLLEGRFIDIGVPDDLARAQILLGPPAP